MGFLNYNGFLLSMGFYGFFNGFPNFDSEKFLRSPISQPSSFLKFWPSEVKFLIKEFLIKKECIKTNEGLTFGGNYLSIMYGK